MKHTKYFGLLMAAVLMANSAFAISADDKKNISDGLNDFSTNLLYALPQAATQQNVWADAMIGKLFPAFPPHLGAGISIGATTIDMRGLKKASDALINSFNTVSEQASGLNDVIDLVNKIPGVDINKIDLGNLSFGEIPDTFYLPTATVDARIGGLFLPFDIGVCAMTTNPSLDGINLENPESILSAHSNIDFDLFGFKGNFDYFTLGIDLRYALLEESLVVPGISLGAGYYYTEGAIGLNTSNTTNTMLYGTQKTSADVNVAFKSEVAYLQAEISKEIAIVTLFGGARGLVTKSTNSWAWKFETENDKLSENEVLNQVDSDSGCVSSGNLIDDVYKDGNWDFSTIIPQVYAGVGLNFFILQTTVGVCADMGSFFRTGTTQDIIYSGFFSFRVKL